MEQISLLTERQSEQFNVINQVVVSLNHVEAVLNRVIPDLEKVLFLIPGWDEPNESKRCITKQDIEQALAGMRTRMVTEIRYKEDSYYWIYNYIYKY